MPLIFGVNDLARAHPKNMRRKKISIEMMYFLCSIIQYFNLLILDFLSQINPTIPTMIIEKMIPEILLATKPKGESFLADFGN